MSYKIYEKEGYKYVHYDGYPKGIRIEKDENLYNYNWGWMTVNTQMDFGVNNIHIEDYNLFKIELRGAKKIKKNGKYGLANIEGNEIFPCVFDQIERMAASMFCLRGNQFIDYKFYGGTSCMNADMPKGAFVEADGNDIGRWGWKHANGEIFIPAQYDSIHQWSDNLYILERNNNYTYVNAQGEEVLTSRKYNTGNNPPFISRTNKNDIITLFEPLGAEDKEDKNVVWITNSWVRCTQLSHDEIMKFMVDETDEQPLTLKDMSLFNNDFSYEFSAYMAHSSQPNGIEDCIDKLNKFGTFCSTWYYIIKVWLAPGEEPSAQSLRNLRRFVIDSESQLGSLKFALGHDASLAKGETKMMIITHYNERCWPADFEFDWRDKQDELPLNKMKPYLKNLRKTIESQVYKQHIEEVWQDQLDWTITNITYNPMRSWEETKEVLEYLKHFDKYFDSSIYYTLKYIRSTYKAEQMKFLLNKLQWLLENGANPNYLRESSALDIINTKPQLNDIWMDETLFLNHEELFNEFYKKCKNLLLEYGAKTLEEIRREEDLNNDYKIELERMEI